MKTRALKGLLFGLMCVGSMTFAKADITTGLFLHYTFDGLVASDNTIPDLSGQNHGGTRMGGASYVEGKSGEAINLLTTSDYAYMPDGIVENITDLTIAGWIYKDAANGWDRLCDFATTTDTNMFITTGGPGYARFAIKNLGVYPDGEQVINGSALVFGKWNHIAVTLKYQDGLGLGILYVNGLEVGRNEAISLKPSDLGHTVLNYIGKSVYDADPSVVGSIDDFRLYSRALTPGEIKDLRGVPQEIVDADELFTLADYNKGYDPSDPELYINTNLVLPTTYADSLISIEWSSSDTFLMHNDGTINNLPSTYPDATILTAILTQEDMSITKQFVVRIAPKEMDEIDPLLAKFEFTEDAINLDALGNQTVTDKSAYGFVGTMKGNARIVSMGGPKTNDTLPCLYLENAGDHFDMGAEIGKAVQGLTDYTISVFYRKDNEKGKLTKFTGHGQWLYGFCNSNDLEGSAFGGIFCEPLRGYHAVFTNNYNDERGIQLGEGKFPLGAWHNITYVQNVETAIMYLDGDSVGGSKSTYYPAYALKKSGHNPPTYNYIGEPCYSSDPRASKTHIAGLYIYNIALSQDDMEDPSIIGVKSKLTKLDAAYAENPEIVGEELQLEYDALEIGDVSNLKTGDTITLVTKGTIDENIKISWNTGMVDYISSQGVITQPKYFDVDSIKITATLSKGTTFLIKPFYISLKVDGGYKGDVIADFNFADAIYGQPVIDKGEMKFAGNLKEESYIATIGNGESKTNVLYLGEGDGYFDMGKEIGKAIVGLDDYTISIFYRKDDNGGELTKFTDYGQWLYGFANTDNLGSKAWGAMYYEPLRGRHVCTFDNYNSEESTMVGTGSNNLVGSWHNITAVQKGDSCTLFTDGFNAASQPCQSPKMALRRDDMSGTQFNNLGKPAYSGDPYLQKTMISRVVIYKKAMSESEIATTFDIDATILNLDAAFAANDGQGSILAIDLAGLIEKAYADTLLNYAGKADLILAINDAENAIKENTVTEESITALKNAVKAYYFTQPASANAPADYTFAIINPSFEGLTNGTIDPNSIGSGTNYHAPEGWTLYYNHEGGCNAVNITAAPSDGSKGYETWAETVHEFDLYQDIVLPAGNYILSAEVRTNTAAPYDVNVYANVGEISGYNALFESPTLDSNLINTSSWQTLENWQTLYAVFNVKEDSTLVRLGLNSKHFAQYDNFRLEYTGSEMPKDSIDMTASIANPSFELGEGGSLDTTSIATGGKYPLGWTIYKNATDNGNTVITGAATDGTSGYETWGPSGSITEFALYQNIVAPASGRFVLSADFRCDASSPSATDSINPYDAVVYAKVGNFGKLVSSTLWEACDSVEQQMKGWTNWKTLSVEFEARIGETITIGSTSSSFKQLDNFKLIYTQAPTGTIITGMNESIAPAKLKVFANNGVIYVSGAAEKVSVYDITGRQVNVNSNEINVASGIYIVKSGKDVVKIMVK